MHKSSSSSQKWGQTNLWPPCIIPLFSDSSIMGNLYRSCLHPKIWILEGNFDFKTLFRPFKVSSSIKDHVLINFVNLLELLLTEKLNLSFHQINSSFIQIFRIHWMDNFLKIIQFAWLLFIKFNFFFLQ